MKDKSEHLLQAEKLIRSLAEPHIPEGTGVQAIIDQWLHALAIDSQFFCDSDISTAERLKKKVISILKDNGVYKNKDDFFEVVFGNLHLKPTKETKFTFIDFPEKGASAEWICLGVNGSDDKTCSASRADDPVNGQCGTAHDKTYLASSNSFGLDSLCLSETKTGVPFPSELGERAEWTCPGINGGQSASCTAQKAESYVKPVVVFTGGSLRACTTTPEAPYCPIMGVPYTLNFYANDPDGELDSLVFDFDDGRGLVTKLPPAHQGVIQIPLTFNKELLESLSPLEQGHWLEAKPSLTLKTKHFEDIEYAQGEIKDESTPIQNGAKLFYRPYYQGYFDKLREEEVERLAEIDRKRKAKKAEIDAKEREREEASSNYIDNKKEAEVIADEYVDTARNAFEDLDQDEVDQSCPWLEKDNTCISSYQLGIDLKGRYTSGESEKDYPYTIHVQYKQDIDLFDLADLYPAVVWLESKHPSFGFTSEWHRVTGPQHLKTKSNFLIEEMKGRIDSHLANSPSKIKEEFDNIGFDDEVESTLEHCHISCGNEDYDFASLDERMTTAVTEGFGNYSTEIYEAALKAQKSISLVFDSEEDSVTRAKSAPRAVYQVSLGVLKAFYGLGEGLVYGAGKEEFDSINAAIVDYTEDEFRKLSEEKQEKIRSLIQDTTDIINTNEETRAAAELLLIAIDKRIGKGKDKPPELEQEIIDLKLTPKDLSNNAIERSIGGEFVETPRDIRRYLDEGNGIELSYDGDDILKKSGDIEPSEKGSMGRKKMSEAFMGDLNSEIQRDLAQQLKDNPTGVGMTPKQLGDILESLVEDYFKTNFKGYESYTKSGKYGSGVDNKGDNNGYDHVFIKKDSQGNIEDILIIDSKPIGKDGSTKFTYHDTDTMPDTLQMSNKWMTNVNESLTVKGGEFEELATIIMDNESKITKVVASFGKYEHLKESYGKIIIGQLADF